MHEEQPIGTAKTIPSNIGGCAAARTHAAPTEWSVLVMRSLLSCTHTHTHMSKHMRL